MSKFTEELRTISIREILTILVSSLVAVLVTIGIAIRDPLENIVLQNVPKSILVLLPILLLLLLILAMLYIISLRKRLANKLFSSCGVYWDKDFNPHCPSCQKLLGNYAFYVTDASHSSPGFFCVNCKNVIRLSDSEKIFMNIDEAKEKAKALYDGNKK